MPIDATELAQAITAANGPLVRAVDKLELQIQRMAERLDQLPTVYMARAEYEPRHMELRARVEALETKIGEEHRWSLSEHARLSDQTGKALDEFRDEVRAEQQTSRGHWLTIWIAAGGWIFGVLSGVLSIVVQHFWK